MQQDDVVASHMSLFRSKQRKRDEQSPMPLSSKPTVCFRFQSCTLRALGFDSIAFSKAASFARAEGLSRSLGGGIPHLRLAYQQPARNEHSHLFLSPQSKRAHPIPAGNRTSGWGCSCWSAVRSKGLVTVKSPMAFSWPSTSKSSPCYMGIPAILAKL